MASEDRCIFCGEIVPEGRIICPRCEKAAEPNETANLLVYVCSPLRAYPRHPRQKNINRAREYCRIVAERGYVPIAPHIYCTQFLDDNNPAERNQGMDIGKLLMLKCGEVWVFGGYMSAGMKAELAFAAKHSIPVRRIVLK